jgi:imidazolonepropionase-like amidohydrolase/ABC-type multidrug transport system permease subunit
MLRSYWALIKIDLKLAFRNKSVLFFNYFFPLFFFFVFGSLFKAAQGTVVLQVITMVTAIGILGNGLYGAGMRAVQERETNVLRRYKVTPIGPLPLLVASMVSGLMIYLPALFATLVLAVIMYGFKVPANIGSFLIFACLACVAFRAIGLIVSSVVNSMQESMVLIQPLYMSMLFLSGATIPIAIFPGWLQTVTQFIPATYLMTGMGGILQRGESIVQNWPSVLALFLTACVGVFLSTKLFRWEKEDKLGNGAKLWVLVVLFPFLVLGTFQAWSKENLTKQRVLMRDLERGETVLIKNTRIFIGDGRVIENGSVLVKDGKIAQIFPNSSPDEKALKASLVDGSGKTLLPGLIDMHVHLGAPGGFPSDPANFDYEAAGERELEAYLFSGVTAVRSAGDLLSAGLKYRKLFNSGERLGTELFICGPLFTAPKGHGTEYAKRIPEQARAYFNQEFLRLPKSEDEARKMVDLLADQHVDAIKGILDAGAFPYLFERMDLKLLAAVVNEAHARNLPASIHTGSLADVNDAVAMGTNSVEHGSYIDQIPDATFAAMKAKGIVFDPTLSVAEGFNDFARGDTSLLKRPLTQQVTSKDLVTGTEKAASSKDMEAMRKAIGEYPMSLDIGKQNLMRAWKDGVTLVTGSDAGNYMVFHGPTVQHEIELWISAGIPPAVALQAATQNAAQLLRASDRFGTIAVGKDATLLMVDGNPLQDVHALSAISMVMFKGENVNRTDLFTQK